MREGPLVRVEHVSKKFCRSLRQSLWYGVKDLGNEVLARSGRGRLELRRNEFLAVDDVSFELQRGECLGLIGPNGAGKSTLLKMLNGLVRPDGGRIAMRGRVGALIELGAGFNPVLTGRENVYVASSVLGLRKREIDARFDQIVEFAELGEFIDAPVQSYSSGMRVRLGFAVAAHLEPDVLLIDEVLAVGDLSFVLKCFNLLDRRLERTAIILVSHQMPQIARACTRAIALDGGRVLAAGSPATAIDAYLARTQLPAATFHGDDGARIERVRFVGETDGDGDSKPFAIRHLDDLAIDLRFTVPARYPHPVVYLAIHDRQLRGVGETQQRSECVLRNTGALMEVRVTMPRINLSQGVYTISLGVKAAAQGAILATVQSVRSFQVVAEHNMWMPIHFESRFEQLY